MNFLVCVWFTGMFVYTSLELRDQPWELFLKRLPLCFVLWTGPLIGLELTGSARLADHQAPDIPEGRLEQWLVLQCWR